MASALKRIRKEIMEIIKEPNELFTIVPDIIETQDNLRYYDIEGIMLGNSEQYKNGMFKFKISIPHDYPNKPPVFTFTNKLFHPNIHSDGKVCISILHEGTDVTGYEDDGLRWSSIHTLYSIIASIHWVLHNPNDESPANIDAALMLRTNLKEYNRMIHKIVASTHNEII
jgi:ubiquitin-conjugating enzyme E2 G1